MDTASQLKQLLNNGVGYANDVPCTSQATIIVVGAPRSGTSMIAAALDALGIYMGDNKDDAVFEDRRIAHGLEKDPSKLPGIIADYNAHHSIWGFNYHAPALRHRTQKPLSAVPLQGSCEEKNIL